MTILKRWLWILVIASIFTLPLMWLSAYLMTKSIKPYHAEIENILQKESQVPVKVQDVMVRWWGSILPRLVLRQVTITDKAMPLSVDEIIADIDLSQSAFTKTIKIKSLTLKNLKITYEKRDAQKTDPRLILAFLTKQNVTLENAEIVWKRSNPIHLRVDGKFESFDDNLKFRGKTGFKIGEEGDFLTLKDIQIDADLNAREANISGNIVNTVLQCTLKWPEHSPLHIALQAVGRNIDMGLLHKAANVSPEDSAWLSWVLHSIIDANLKELNLNVTGPLGNLDFSGTFSLADLILQFAPHWPRIENAAGIVTLDKEAVKVKLDKGKIGENSMQSVDAVIGPLNNPKQHSEVSVVAHVDGKLEQGIAVLQSSPLKEGVGKRLADLKLTGPMQLTLGLQIPLGNSEKSTTVDGQVQTKNARFFVEELDLPGSELQGDFHFTDKGIEVKNAKAQFLDTTFTIDAHQNKINATGLVTTHFLQTHFDLPLFKSFSGESLMTASIFLNEDYWQLSSDLKGVTIDLPIPFKKTAEQSKPLKFTLYPVVQGERRFALNIEGLMEGKWIVSSPSQQLKRAELVFGSEAEANWPIEDSLSIKGNIPELDANTWWLFLKKTQTLDKLPLHLQITSDVLNFFGLNFEKTTLSYDSRSKNLVSLDGPAIKGSISLPDTSQKAINLEFDKLHLKSNGLNPSMDMSMIQDVNRVPVIFLAKELKFNDAWFGKVEFQLEPQSEGYEIQNLSAKATSFLLEAKGHWHFNATQSSALSGELYSTDMGQTFSLWGFKSAIRHSSGRLKFELQWPGAPFQFSLQMLEGNAELDIKSGRIMGVDPGLGRIFGLLSLDSIRRRLQLDFSDLFSKGFVFDTLYADMHFSQGVAKTNTFTIEGPAANIKMQGSANLNDKALDLILSVRPHVSSGLPLAATIASGGNPAVGAGAWVLEKLIGKSVSKITEHRYRVTGSWDTPKITELGVPAREKRK